MRNQIGVVLNAVFASLGDRVTFPAFTDGWDVDYSTPSSGKFPERTAMNDLFAKVTACCVDLNRYGSAMPWDTNITYEQFAIVTSLVDGKLYVASSQNTGLEPSANPGEWSLLIIDVSALDLKVDLDGGNIDPISKDALRTALDLEQVDDTADVNKPISIDQQAALDTKASKIQTNNVAKQVGLAHSVQFLEGGSDGRSLFNRITPDLVCEVCDVSVPKTDKTVNQFDLVPIPPIVYPVIIEETINTLDADNTNIYLFGITTEPLGTYSSMVRMGTTGNLQIERTSPATGLDASGYSLKAGYDDGEDHHMVLVLESESQARLYVDGGLVVSSNAVTVESQATHLITGALLSTIGNVTRPSIMSFYGRKVTMGDEGIALVGMFAGQSNCGGLPSGVGSLPVSIQTNQIHTRWIRASNDYFNEPLGIISSTAWGQEITAFNQIFNETGKKFNVLKSYKGGTSLARHWQQGQQEYVRFVGAYNQQRSDILATGKTPQYDVFWWDQGEEDSNDLAEAEAYYDNFLQMISDFATDLIGFPSDIPIIIRRLWSSRDRDYHPYVDKVIDAQNRLALLPNIYIYDLDDQPTQDGSHFDSDALQLGGIRFAKTYLEIYPELNYSMYLPSEEGSGLSFDVMGGGYHGSSGSTSWVKSDSAPSWSHSRGFRITLIGTPPYIPALADGSAAADTNPITNQPGKVHNNFDGKIIQTNDALLHIPEWSANGLSFDKKSFDELLELDGTSYTTSLTDANGLIESTFTFGEI